LTRKRKRYSTNHFALVGNEPAAKGAPAGTQGPGASRSGDVFKPCQLAKGKKQLDVPGMNNEEAICPQIAWAIRSNIRKAVQGQPLGH
jgi:hypothetical protein